MFKDYSKIWTKENRYLWLSVSIQICFPIIWSLHKNIHTFLFYSLICRHSLFLLPVCWWLWWSLKRNQCQFQHHLHSSLAFKLLDLATSSKSFLELVTQHQDSLVLLENVFDDGKNKTLKTQTIVGNYFRCKIKS